MANTVYAMSDIHGHLEEFRDALDQVNLADVSNTLVLCGDYIDRGPCSREVIDLIRCLQRDHPGQVIALAGNHDLDLLEWTRQGWQWEIAESETLTSFLGADEFARLKDMAGADKASFARLARDALVAAARDELAWIASLPLMERIDDVVFVHAGVDEDAGEFWRLASDEDMLTRKWPASVGDFLVTIVAGHVGAAEVAGDAGFCGVFHDGASHFYLDGSVERTHTIPILVWQRDDDAFASLHRTTDDTDWRTVPL